MLGSGDIKAKKDIRSLPFRSVLSVKRGYVNDHFLKHVINATLEICRRRCGTLSKKYFLCLGNSRKSP